MLVVSFIVLIAVTVSAIINNIISMNHESKSNSNSNNFSILPQKTVVFSFNLYD